MTSSRSKRRSFACASSSESCASVSSFTGRQSERLRATVMTSMATLRLRRGASPLGGHDRLMAVRHRVSDTFVFAVVPGHSDHGWSAEIESMAERWKKVFGAFDRIAGDTERPCELDEVGIAELGRERAAELTLFVHFDDAETPIDQHNDDDCRAQTLGRFELLDVHQKAAVAAERHHLAIGVHELRSDGAWQSDAH